MYINLLNLFSRRGAGRVRFFRLAAGLLLFSGFMPAWADGPGKMLSEQDAVRLGLGRPKIVQQIQSRRALAQSDVVEAGTWANPEFSYDQESFSEGSTDITEKSCMLSQEFSLSGWRGIKTEAAKQRRDAAELEIDQWRLTKTAEIRKIFYEALYQQQIIEIYAQMRSAMDDLEKVMRERRNAGDISGYDLSRLQQERALLISKHGQALAEQQRLIQEFSTHMGMADNEAAWPGVTGNLFPSPLIQPLETILEQATKQPGLTAMKLHATAFGADERHAKRAWLPDPTIGLGYKQTNAAGGNSVLFNVSVPIPVFDRNAVARQRAAANRRYMQSEYELAVAEKNQSLRGLWRQDRELAAAVKSLGETDSAALLETAKIAYQAGEIGVLEILDAHRSAFEHQVRLLDLMKASRMVRINLELNTGGIIQ